MANEVRRPPKNRIQTKILNADVTSDITMSDLTFNNLEVGKWYEIRGKFFCSVNDGVVDGSIQVNANHDSNVIERVQLNITAGADAVVDITTLSMVSIFQATTTTLSFSLASASVNSYISGNGTRQETFVQLEERNDLVETGDFT